MRQLAHRSQKASAWLVRSIWFAIAVAPTAVAGPAVVVQVIDEGRFEVLHSRMKTSGTGSAIFGLIGHGIEESARLMADAKREEEILAFVPEPGCQAGFVQSILDRLWEKGIEAQVATSANDIDSADIATIEVRIRGCGFMLVNTKEDEHSAFHAVTYRFRPAGSPGFDDGVEMLVTGRGRAQWQELVTDPDLATAEFDLAKRRAGRKLANKFIYAPNDDHNS